MSFTRRRWTQDVLLDRLPESPATAPDDASGVWLLLDGLPTRQRVVLVLLYDLGSTDEEIAAILGCRRGTVRSLASRALSDLRERMITRSTAEGASS